MITIHHILEKQYKQKKSSWLNGDKVYIIDQKLKQHDLSQFVILLFVNKKYTEIRSHSPWRSNQNNCVNI